MSEPSCQTCIYRQQDERPEYSMSGFCHRYPPRIIFETYDAGMQGTPAQYYPWVTPDDWCGDHREAARI